MLGRDWSASAGNPDPTSSGKRTSFAPEDHPVRPAPSPYLAWFRLLNMAAMDIEGEKGEVVGTQGMEVAWPR